jgi:transposase InsO family protein
MAALGEAAKGAYTVEQKLLILDVWNRAKLPSSEFSSLVGVSAHTLGAWKKRFEQDGPEGLLDRARGREKGSQVDETTRRAILVIKESRPEYGSQRISDILYRGPGLTVSPTTVSRVLKEEGYEPQEAPSQPHEDKERRFERAKPNQLWQTDFFTFLMKRAGFRVHLVGFLDDHSRFITGYGLAASASTGLAVDTLRGAIGSWGAPDEVLTDQGPQYYTWRGKSAFARELEKRGIKHLVSHAKRPQTLGKIERFWGTLWTECVEKAVFLDLEDARRRIGLFIDHYNFQRTNQGIEGMVPADRFFSAGSDVRKTLEARVSANALELAKNGAPRKTFYLTGRVGDVGLSLHAEGEKVVMTTEDGRREEVDLRAPGKRAESGEEAAEALPEPVTPQGLPANELPEATEPESPGESALDEGLAELEEQGLLAEGVEGPVQAGGAKGPAGGAGEASS